MEHKGYEIKRVDDRGWGIFERGTNKVAWICEHWVHEQYGQQITVNLMICSSFGDAKIFIENELMVDDGQVLLFATSPEEARENMEDRLSKPKPPELPPTFIDEYPLELIG